LKTLESARKCEGSLTEFIKGGWKYIDPNPYVPGWHIEAVAEHLEAVADGDIKRLIINIPPRSSKSSIVSVAYPAWTWCQAEGSRGPLSGPQVQFLTTSYAGSLSLRDSVKTRRLIASPWYQERWGDRFKLMGDQNAKQRYDNDKAGYRIATSVGGALTGEGGAVLIIDDPHNAMEAQSDLVRQGALDWYDNALSTRLNDPKTGAIILVMQRLHRQDLTGHLLERGGWEHLMLPMSYDPIRHCTTGIGWSDPRTEAGELLMPDRFGPDEVEDLSRALGPYSASGQLQQDPVPAGGGILKRDYWMLWDDDACVEHGVSPGSFPQVDYIVASLDTAYTEKKENDCSALVIMGLWHDRGENPRLIVMNAWAKRLELHGQMIERLPGETDAEYISRTKPGWGLVEWVAHSCKRFRVDLLLVESTAAGIPVEQELRRLHRHEGFGVRLIPPKGDKVSRAYLAQSPLADGLIYAPERAWSEELIDQCERFPKDVHDDLVDAFTQGVKFFKDTGMLVRGQDIQADFTAMATHKSPLKPIYEA
jgi:predicted phage terminase large subunit-like protein